MSLKFFTRVDRLLGGFFFLFFPPNYLHTWILDRLWKEPIWPPLGLPFLEEAVGRKYASLNAFKLILK
jgi:hypothetical protein